MTKRHHKKLDSKHRLEILRINGDVYINGEKILFMVDYHNPPRSQPEYATVDWLLGWAKIGLMSVGHVVPHFHSRTLQSFEEAAKKNG